MTASAPERTRPRPPALDRATAYRLAATEYDRFVAQLSDLGPGDWAQPTECTAWDVRAMAGHVLGMAEMAASTWQLVRQNALAFGAGGGIDGLTTVQVRDHEHLEAPALVAALAAAAPRALHGRRRLSRSVGAMPLPQKQVVGPDREWWRIGFLVDVILTRDVWMHRGDIARATGREPVLTAEHDGVLVADVVAEWAQRHGQPYRLRLTGPAGGSWSSGVDGEEIEADAVEFCRIVSGRAEGEGLLRQQVPF